MRTVLAVTLIFLAGCATPGADLTEHNMLQLADRVTVRLFMPDRKAQASGVIIGKRETATGCAVLVGTARHVMLHDGKASKVALGIPDGIVATRVSWSEAGDAAAAEFGLPGACADNAYGVAAVATAATRGQKIFGSGYPRGQNFFSWGTVLEPEVKDGDGEAMTVAYPGAPGHSGGPIFNSSGQVVGVLSGGYPNAPLLAFFARASHLRAAANKLSGWSI